MTNRWETDWNLRHWVNTFRVRRVSSIYFELTSALIRLIALIVSAIFQHTRLRWNVLRWRRISHILRLILPGNFGKCWRSGSNWRCHAVWFVRIRRWIAVLNVGGIDRSAFIVRGWIKRALIRVGFNLLFSSESSRSSSQASLILKHVLSTWVDRPIMTLSGLAAFLRQLLKTLVETQVMSNWVFPPVVVAIEERISARGRKYDLIKYCRRWLRID